MASPLETNSVMEAFLRRDDAVKHARVLNLASPPDTGEPPKWVVALSLDPSGVAAEGSSAAIVKRIRRALRASFRDSAVVPATWAVFDSFPTVPSGAVDDAALAQQLAGLEAASGGASTLNKLRGIVATVLKMPLAEVVASSAYIKLGGDSIKAVEVMSRCMAAGLNVRVRDIMDAKSLAELAAMVRPAGRHRSRRNSTASTSSQAGAEERRAAREGASVLRYWDAADKDLKKDNCVSREFKLHKTVADSMTRATRSGDPLVVVVAAMQHSFHRSFPDHEGPMVWLGDAGKYGSLGHPQAILDDFKLYVQRAKDGLARARKMLRATREHSPVVEVLVSYVSQESGAGRSGHANGHVNGYFRPSGLVNGDVSGHANGSNHMDVVEISAGAPQAIFDIQVVQTGEDITLELRFPRNLKRSADVLEWFAGIRVLLESELPGLDGATQIYSLSDFPRLPLTYPELDKLLPTIDTVGFENVDNIYPTSALQDGILISQMTSSEVYRVECVFEMSSASPLPAVDLRRLEAAWSEVVLQHAALRTIFTPSARHGAMFDQIVLKNIRPETLHCGTFTSVDDATAALSSLPAAVFSSGRPAHRLSTALAATGNILCKLEISHAVIDGISLYLVCNALSRARNGQPAKKHRADFASYIAYLQDNPRDKAMAYWTDLLRGIQPCVFPSLVDQPDVENTMKTVSVDLDLPEVKRFCRGQGITVATLLKAAWCVVLRGYTMAEDVCFGYLVSGRDVPIVGMKSVVGPLISLIVCRAKFDELKTGRDLLEFLKRQLGNSMENKDVSLAEVQHAVAPGKRGLFNTLLSVMYEVQKGANAEGDVEVSVKSSHAPTEVSNRPASTSGFSDLFSCPPTKLLTPASMTSP